MGIANAHTKFQQPTYSFVGSSNINHWGYNPPVEHRSRVHSHKVKRKHHNKVLHREKHPGVQGDAPRPMAGLVTVPTEAHISITVAKNLANQFQGFIADLVKLGYTPKQIHCWAPLGTHVPNSNHYHGGACDFDQTGWNRTASPMYHISALTAKWGLRDGCSFKRADCGHVDDGTNIGWKHPNNLIAKYIDFQTSPVQRRQQPKVLDNFEGGVE